MSDELKIILGSGIFNSSILLLEKYHETIEKLLGAGILTSTALTNLTTFRNADDISLFTLTEYLMFLVLSNSNSTTPSVGAGTSAGTGSYYAQSFTTNNVIDIFYVDSSCLLKPIHEKTDLLINHIVIISNYIEVYNVAMIKSFTTTLPDKNLPDKNLPDKNLYCIRSKNLTSYFFNSELQTVIPDSTIQISNAITISKTDSTEFIVSAMNYYKSNISTPYTFTYQSTNGGDYSKGKTYEELFAKPPEITEIVPSGVEEKVVKAKHFWLKFMNLSEISTQSLLTFFYTNFLYKGKDVFGAVSFLSNFTSQLGGIKSVHDIAKIELTPENHRLFFDGFYGVIIGCTELLVRASPHITLNYDFLKSKRVFDAWSKSFFLNYNLYNMLYKLKQEDKLTKEVVSNAIHVTITGLLEVNSLVNPKASLEYLGSIISVYGVFLQILRYYELDQGTIMFFNAILSSMWLIYFLST